MSKDVIIPALGESISSGILSSWKVKDGSFVEIDQPIYELETDKITQEGLAESNGVISFLVKEGEEVEIGSTIAQIDDTQEEKKSSEKENEYELEDSDHPEIEQKPSKPATPELIPQSTPPPQETAAKPEPKKHFQAFSGSKKALG